MIKINKPSKELIEKYIKDGKIVIEQLPIIKSNFRKTNLQK